MSNIGIPIKLLYEAEGMKVTVEVRYRHRVPRVQIAQPCPARFLTTFSFHEEHYPNWEIDSSRVLSFGCM